MILVVLEGQEVVKFDNLKEAKKKLKKKKKKKLGDCEEEKIVVKQLWPQRIFLKN